MSFRKTVFSILKRGQELSGAEKMLVNKEIDDFTKRWESSTGEELRPTITCLEIFSFRLGQYHFKMPIIESWLKEDATIGRDIMIARSQSGFPEKKF